MRINKRQEYDLHDRETADQKFDFCIARALVRA